MDKDVFEDEIAHTLPTRCTDCDWWLTLKEAMRGDGICDACWREHIEVQETGDGGDAVGAGVRW